MILLLKQSKILVLIINILIQPQAKEDIKNIWLYTFKTWGVKQADLYTKDLGVTIDLLSVNPKIGFTIEHVKEGYRLYRFRHHFIVYLFVSNSIVITRVLNKNMYVNKQL